MLGCPHGNRSYKNDRAVGVVKSGSVVNIRPMRVGQKVRVKTCRDLVSKEISAKIGQVGVIQGEKIVDGGKMGYIVTFSDDQSTWFFGDELESVN